MKEPFSQTVVLALCLVMFVQVYIGIVQIVSASRPTGILRSLTLSGSRSSVWDDELPMGDTLRLVAESTIAKACRLRIYNGPSIVLEESICFAGSTAEANVFLNPPTFNVGTYTVALDAYAYDSPIPGVGFSDSEILTFRLTKVETVLELNATYDGFFRSVQLKSSLTDGEGQPVVSETINYQAKLVEKTGLTDGWIHLGSSRSDDRGIAEAKLAFCMPNGNYSIMAYHEGTANFGASSDVVCLEVHPSDGAAQGLSGETGSRSSNIAPLAEGNSGNLTIAVSSGTPFALLPMNASASYSVESPLAGDHVVMFFFLDYMNGTGVLGAVECEIHEGPPYYSYLGRLVWSPEVVGSHTLIVGIANGTTMDIVTAFVTGVGMHVSGEAGISIQPCPSNIIVHCGEAFSADALPVTVAFSRPRPYQVGSNGFYVSTSLSPKLVYNGGTYAIDEPVSSIPVNLYINGTLVSQNLTDDAGLARFAPEVSVGSHAVANITAVINESVLLYERPRIQRATNFTKVTLSDEVNGSAMFALAYTIGGNGTEGNDVYVGTENPITASVTLFGLPLWNVPVAFTVAENISRSATSSGLAAIPEGSDYVRVTRVYETLESSQRVKIRFDGGQIVYVDEQVFVEIPSEPNASSTSLTVVESPLIGDVDANGDVDLFDMVAVAKAYGSYPNSTHWNPQADLNNDGTVDIFDVGIVASHYGDNERVGADLEFIIGASLMSESTTNNLGLAAQIWNPAETGGHAVGVMVPASFSVTVASWVDTTQINAFTSLIDSFDVVKRPVDLSVTYTPEDPTLDDDVMLVASCVDAVLGEPVNGASVDFHAYDLYRAIYVSIGSASTNSSGVATLLWHPKSFSQQHDIWPNYFLRVVCAEGEYTEMAEVEPVHIDTRYPTQLEFLGSEVMNVHVGFSYDLQWRLTSEADGTPLANEDIWIYYMNNSIAQWTTTDSNGIATWAWSPSYVGTFWFRAIFQGLYLEWYYATSNEVKVVAVADVLPVSILFDIQPREFEPGDYIALIATVFNVSSGLPLPSVAVSFYVVDAEGEAGWLSPDSLTNGSGVATRVVPYVIGPNAYFAKVGVNQTIMSSTVMLTVAEETGLRLDVERSESGFSHTISGSLSSDGEPVGNRQVKIYVNDTLEAEVTTQLYGSFSITVNLPPADNKPTIYTVQAVFEGDEPSNAMAYGYTPNGTRYTVCTTVQYGNKPASNTTWLTVEPQATQVMQPTKTPEQMQQEAENSGCLSTWHEFSWWYPWYRLHMKINTNGTIIDVGFNPILPFGETYQWEGLEIFAEVLAEFVEELAIDVGILFLQYIVAKGSSMVPITWIPAATTLALKFGTQLWLLLNAWSNQAKMLAVALVNFIMALIATRVSIGVAFINAFFNVIYAGTMSAIYLVQNKLIVAAEPLQHIRTWIDGLEIAMDLSLGVTALARFLGWV